METHFSFTKPQLEALAEPAPGERVIYHDTHKNAAGLQLRVTSTSKTFFIQKRVDGKPERVTVGKFPDYSIENARKEAARLSALIAEGINPNNDARALKTETTLQELFDSFLQHRRNKRGAFFRRKPNGVTATTSGCTLASGAGASCHSSKIPTSASYIQRSAKNTPPRQTE